MTVTQIESENGWFRAVLTDSPEGVVVAVSGRRPGGVWVVLVTQTLDYPMHVVCDAIGLHINSLRREVILPSGRIVFAKY